MKTVYPPSTEFAGECVCVCVGGGGGAGKYKKNKKPLICDVDQINIFHYWYGIRLCWQWSKT